MGGRTTACRRLRQGGGFGHLSRPLDRRTCANSDPRSRKVTPRSRPQQCFPLMQGVRLSWRWELSERGPDRRTPFGDRYNVHCCHVQQCPLAPEVCRAQQHGHGQARSTSVENNDSSQRKELAARRCPQRDCPEPRARRAWSRARSQRAADRHMRNRAAPMRSDGPTPAPSILEAPG